MEIDAQQHDAADRFTAGLRPAASRPLISSVGRTSTGIGNLTMYRHASRLIL